MASQQIDVQAMLHDPDFLGLSTIEKRKVLLRVEPDFKNLPIPEQSKFIESLTGRNLSPQKDVGPIRGGLEQIKENFQGFANRPTGLSDLAIRAIDPGNLVIKPALAQVPLIERSAKEAYSRVVHPTQQQPLQGLHAVEAMTPIVGPMMANLEDKPLGEAAGRGAVDIATLAGSEFFRFFKDTGIKPEEMSPGQIKDVIGRSIKEGLQNADQQLRKEVSLHADHVAKTVDDPARNPVPAINASQYIENLQSAWNKYIATGEQNPKAVIGHRIPADIQKSVSEAFSAPGGRWTFEQAKQVRSALEEYAAKSDDATVRAVAIEGSKELLGQMRKAAVNAGVEQDFDAYRDLHKSRMKMQETVLDKLRGEESGERIMNFLNSVEGYVKNTVLPSLAKYGLDPEAVKSALKATEKGAKTKWLHDWRTRYAAGAIIHATTGVPWLAGAAGTGVIGEAIESSRAAEQAEAARSSAPFQRGQEIVGESIAGGKTPVKEPGPIPEKPKPQVVQKSLPAVGTIKTSSTVEAQPIAEEKITKESPHEEEIDRYADTKQRLSYLRTINSAITKLARGSKRALNAQELGWIEDETSLDLTNPDNIAKARKSLMIKRARLLKVPKEKAE